MAAWQRWPNYVVSPDPPGLEFRVTRLGIGLFASLLLLIAAACGGGGDDDGGSESSGDGDSTATASATREGDEGDDSSGDDSGDSDSPGDDDSDDDGGSVSNGDGGTCEYRVTGDVELSGTATGGNSSFGSDYYYSDDEMREILRAFAAISEEDDDEIDRLVDEGMQSDPRLYIIILNCVDGNDFSLSLLPSGDATYADVPFGPGTYVIAEGGPLGGSTAPNEFAALLGLDEDGVFGVSEAGELVIERWDERGIAGTFSFGMEELFAEGEPRSFTVEGSFEFECVDGDRCES